MENDDFQANISDTQSYVDLSSIKLLIIFFDYVYRPFALPILFLLGVFGNIVSIKCFLTRTDWNSTGRIYYLTLAVFDLLYLLSFTLPEWSGEGLYRITEERIYFFPENTNQISCVSLRFFWHLSMFISTWTMVFYSAERMISIAFPFLRQKLLTIKNAKIICWTLVIFGFLIFSPVLYSGIYLRHEDAMNLLPICYINWEVNLIVVAWFWFVVFFLTVLMSPIVLALNNLILYVLLLYYFQKRAGMVANLSRGQANTTPVEVQRALDLIWLSIIMLAFTLPSMIWIVIFVQECMSCL